MTANRNLNETVDEILAGSYDLHVHAGPDPAQARRLDALDAARHAQEAGIGGFVLKSHHYPTASLADALNRVYPGLDVIGSITLNRAVGGINPDAVEAAAGIGAGMVWMPTRDAASAGGDIGLLGEDGGLREDVIRVLEVVAGDGMALASGHVTPAEAIALFRAAKDRGIDHLVATHPHGSATADELKEMASLGAFIEHTFVSCMPTAGSVAVSRLIDNVRSVGVEHSVVTSDFGQWQNPPPAEGLRMAIAALLDGGVTADEVETLVKHNPRTALGLDG